MIRVTVAQTTVETINYKSKRDGSAQQLFKQAVYLFTVDEAGNPPPFPEKVGLMLDRDANGKPLPIAVGEYTLHPSAIYVDRDGNPALRLSRLTPLKPQPKG